MPEKHYDLGMTYYRDRDDRLSMTRVTKRECNTRSHEAWGFPSYRPLTDEEIYCAVRWTKERYYLISRSEEFTSRYIRDFRRILLEEYQSSVLPVRGICAVNAPSS